jgi:RluA family pseudouridine synthase
VNPVPPLAILAAGEGYVAISKPAGRIVVPGRGRAAEEITVRQELERQVARPLLVVHRLDRDTSGVLLFATDGQAHRALSRAFERHQVVKHYWALLRGTLVGTGEVDVALVPIRGGLVRAARAGEPGGKPSRTSWRALERIGDFTVVDFRPATGRLHQIRAHAAALGHPLAVDPDYGGASRLTTADVIAAGPASASASASTSEAGHVETILERMSLHARSIKFPHPRGGQAVEVEAPLAADLARGIALLRRLCQPPAH